MGKKKQTTTNEPASWAKPYITQGLTNTQSVFNQQQPILNQLASGAQDVYKSITPGAYQPGQTVDTASQGARDTIGGRFLNSNPYAGKGAGLPGFQSIANGDNLRSNPYAFSPQSGTINDIASGRFLTGNPYLEGIIGQQANDVTGRVNSLFSQSGRYGSGAHQQLLSRNLGEMEGNLRYGNYQNEAQRQLQALGMAQSDNQARMQDYSTERGRQMQALGALQDANQQQVASYDAERARQMQAIGLAPGLRDAEFAGYQPALSLLQTSAGLPWTGVNAYNAGINGLSSGYGVQTTKKSGGLGGVLGGLGTALSLASAIPTFGSSLFAAPATTGGGGGGWV